MAALQITPTSVGISLTGISLTHSLTVRSACGKGSRMSRPVRPSKQNEAESTKIVVICAVCSRPFKRLAAEGKPIYGICENCRTVRLRDGA
jgi:hypothetical protein